jgi:hypothetical protein
LALVEKPELAPSLLRGHEGFDVVPRSIRWCQRKITARHPSFRFQLFSRKKLASSRPPGFSTRAASET